MSRTDTAVRVISGSPDRVFAALTDVALMEKDIHLARKAANELATPLPSAAVADEMGYEVCR